MNISAPPKYVFIQFSISPLIQAEVTSLFPRSKQDGSLHFGHACLVKNTVFRYFIFPSDYIHTTIWKDVGTTKQQAAE